MPQLRVRFGSPREGSYPVAIRAGLLAGLPPLLQREAGPGRIVVITDENVARLYGRALHHALVAGGCDALLMDVPAGERSKDAATAYRLQTRLLARGITRDALIVALGGGVIGDLAGYVAATVLRGVRFVQVPTTLLAQVDSSIGGKVGIDHPAGKNLIGAFHQPSAVYIDPGALRTLPAVELRNGLAEVVKIAAAVDAAFFSTIERSARRIRRDNTPLLTRLIARSVGLKAAIVARDEFETGLRKALNLGHTVGHALEVSSGYRLRHGFGVAMGMVAEADMAVDMGLLPGRERQRLVRTLRSLGLPTSPPRVIDAEAFEAALALDKKSDASGAKLVLLRRIGRCAIGIAVPRETIWKIMGLHTNKSRRH